MLSGDLRPSNPSKTKEFNRLHPFQKRKTIPEITRERNSLPSAPDRFQQEQRCCVWPQRNESLLRHHREEAEVLFFDCVMLWHRFVFRFLIISSIV